MSGIVFEALDWSPDTQGEGLAILPRLQVRGNAAADSGLVLLPALTVTATGTEHASGLASLVLPRLQVRAFERKGGAGLVVLPALQAAGSETADPAPDIGEGLVVLPALVSVASGRSHVQGDAVVSLGPLQAHGFEAAGDWGVVTLPALRVVAIEDATPPANRFDLQQVGGYVYAFAANPLAPEEHVEALAISESLVVHRRLELLAALTASASAQLGHAVNLTEGLEVAAVAQHTAHLQIAAIETTLAAARADVVFRYLLTESVLAADSASTTRRLLISALEALEVSGLVDTRLQAQYILTEALVAHELALRGWRIDLVESVAFAEIAAATRQSVVALVEALVAADLAAMSARFTLVLNESVVAADVASSTAHFLEQLTEALTATAVFTLEGQEYVAWVFNAEGQAPASYYDFGFNSGAQYEGRTFVAMADGFYELTGNDDAGAPITAELVGGLGDFGSSLVKRMSMAYLHLTTDGELVMKFLVHMNGKREEHWYKLEGRMGDAVHPDRVKPDGGLESVTWGWKLTNLAGANFTIDRMRFVPMLTTRRI